MSTDTRRGAMKERTCSVHLSTEPLFPLPTRPDGFPVSPEVAALTDLGIVTLNTLPPGSEIDVSIDPTATSSLEVPSLTRAPVKGLTAKIQLRIPNCPPSQYGLVQWEIGSEHRIDLRLSVRPADGYVFTAGYLIGPGPAKPRSFVQKCLSARWVRLPDGDALEDVVRSLVETEHAALLGEPSSTQRPQLCFGPPLVRHLTRIYGDGALRIEEDHIAHLTHIDVDWAKCENCDRFLRDLIRREIEWLARLIPTSRGPRPHSLKAPDPSEVHRVQSFFSSLLEMLPKGKWPPFRTRHALRDFLLSKLSTTPQDIDPVVGLLWSRPRRPQARVLADEFIAKRSGIGVARLRQLRRK
jgi:hypothetical protein